MIHSKAKRQTWDSVSVNRKLDMALASIRQELFRNAWRPPNLLTEAYIADLIARAEWNRKWQPGQTLKTSWRRETL